MTSPLQQKIKITGTVVVTANRVGDGAVIYRSADGDWTTELDEAVVTSDAAQARHLVDLGLCHAVATDAHQLGDLQQAAVGLAWLDKKLGHATTVRLFDHGPRQILAGELP